MASLRSNILNFMLRNRHVFKGRIRKEEFTLETVFGMDEIASFLKKHGGDNA